jgi:hypothetical protein
MPRPLRILALDPGITTGYVTASVPEMQPILLICGEDKMTHRELWLLLENVSPDIIVCESFEYRSRARDNVELFSREMIGVVNLYDQSNRGVKLVMQSAAKGKSYFGDDKKLKELGVYKVGKPHGRDAMRHFLQWLMFGQGFQYYADQKVQLT